ncbi:MAG: class I SAM-dependent methyltransferase [Pyrinomonadaceae bacterium]
MEARLLATGNVEVAEAYDRWSATYDTDPNTTRQLAGAVLRQHGPVAAQRDVIEIGCGTGVHTLWLAQKARTVIALDFSDGMLSRARERVQSAHVTFVKHNVSRTWPIQDQSSDIVIAMLVLEHVEKLATVFLEARRCLRSSGELFILELHPYKQLEGRQARYCNRETGQVDRITAWLHNISDYINNALEAGFELLRIGEWQDTPLETEVPRLLSLHFASSENAAGKF